MEEYRNWQEEAAEAAPETPNPADEAAREDRMAELMERMKAELEARLMAALDEASRLNAMSPEERAAYDTQARLKALEDREKALERRELKADAQDALAEKGLPAALAEALNCEDRAAMERSVAVLDGAFRQAVQAAVEARLKGTSPAAGASAQDTGDDLDDAAYYRMQAGAH